MPADSTVKNPLRTKAEDSDRYYYSRESLNLYLNEIGRVPLLTLAQERALVLQMQSGENGEREAARDHLIRANLRFVVNIARDYEGYGLPLLDLINEGNIGLMSAVDKYRPDRGAKLSTYAAILIKQSIFEALSWNAKTIRLPASVLTSIRMIRRTNDQLASKLGREPSTHELAVHLGISPFEIRSLVSISTHPVSLDKPVSDDGTMTVGEMIPDSSQPCPLTVLMDSSSVEMLRKAIATLPKRQVTIVMARFGLDDGIAKDYQEISTLVGLTPDRARQLCEKSLWMLRQIIEPQENDRFSSHFDERYIPTKRTPNHKPKR